MKGLFLIFFLSIGFVLQSHAQNDDLDEYGNSNSREDKKQEADSIKKSKVKYIKLDFKIKTGKKPLGGAQVQFYKVGEPVAAVTSYSDGKLSYKLTINSEYLIKVSAEDHVSKIISFNTNVATENLLDLWPQFKFTVELLEGNSSLGTFDDPYVRIKYSADIYDFEPGPFDETELPADELAKLRQSIITDAKEAQVAQELEAQQDAKAEQLRAEAEAKAAEQEAARLETERLQEEANAQTEAVNNSMIAERTTKLAQIKEIETAIEGLNDKVLTAKNTVQESKSIRATEQAKIASITESIEKLKQKEKVGREDLIALNKELDQKNYEKQKLLKESDLIKLQEEVNSLNVKLSEDLIAVSIPSKEVVEVEQEIVALNNQLGTVQDNLENLSNQINAEEKNKESANLAAESAKKSEVLEIINTLKSQEQVLKSESEEFGQLANIALGDGNRISSEKDQLMDASSSLEGVAKEENRLLAGEKDLESTKAFIDAARNQINSLNKKEQADLKEIERLGLESDIDPSKAPANNLVIKSKKTALNRIQEKIQIEEEKLATLKEEQLSKNEALQNIRLDLQEAKRIEEANEQQAQAALIQKAAEEEEARVAASEKLKSEQLLADQARKEDVLNAVLAKKNKESNLLSELNDFNVSINEIQSRLMAAKETVSTSKSSKEGKTGIDLMESELAILNQELSQAQIEKELSQAQKNKILKQIEVDELVLGRLGLEKEIAETEMDKLNVSSQISAKEGTLTEAASSLTNRNRELESAENNINELRSSIQEKMQLIENEEALLASQAASLEAAEAEKLKAAAAVRETARINELNARITALRAKSSSIKEDVQRLETQLNTTNTELDKLSVSKATIENNLAAKEGMDKLKEQVKLEQTKIAVFEKSLESHSKNVSYLSKSKESAEVDKEILELENSLEVSEEKTVAIGIKDNDITGFKSNISASSSDKSNLQNQLDNAKTALVNANNSLNNEIARLETESENLRLQKEAAERERIEAAEKKRLLKEQELLDKKAGLELELSGKNGKILELEGKIQALSTQEKNLIRKSEELQGKLVALKGEVNGEGVEKLEQELAVIGGEIDKIRNDISKEDLSMQLIDVKKEVNVIKQSIAIKEVQLRDVETIVNEDLITANLKGAYNALDNEYIGSKNTYNQLKTSLLTKQEERQTKKAAILTEKDRVAANKEKNRLAEVQRIQNAISTKEMEEEELEVAAGQIGNKVNRLSNELSDLKAKSATLSSEIGGLTGIQAAQKETDIANNAVLIAKKEKELAKANLDKTRKDLEMKQVVSSRLKLEQQIASDQGGKTSAINSILAEISEAKEKEKTLKQRYDEWLAKVQVKEAVATSKRKAYDSAVLLARQQAAEKAEQLKQEAVEKAKNQKAAELEAQRIKDANAEKAASKLNSQKEYASHTIDFIEKVYADGKNKITKTSVKSRQFDDVYLMKYAFKSKKVTYFKNDSPITKFTYEAELKRKKAEYEANKTNNE